MNSEQESLVSVIAEYWSDKAIGTHSESCWQWHPRCVISILTEEVTLLENQLAEKNRIIEKLLSKIVDNWDE
jgi:hypothetical protein